MNTAVETLPPPSARAARLARAFNLGCDARLAGVPLADCPCKASDEQAYWWRQGWWDVTKFWGDDALWPHPDLPAVTQ